MMKRLTLSLSCMLLFLICSSTSPAVQYIDRIVAVVNDDVVTFSELELAGRQIFERLRKQVPAGELDMAMHNARTEVLSSMVDNIIVRQKAKELGIAVDEQEIDNAIAQMLAKINASLEDFRKELALMGLPEKEYRKNLHDQILKSKLIGLEVSSHVVITEEDMKRFYEDDFIPGDGEDGYNVLQMGFSWEKPGAFGVDSSVKVAARKRAEEVRARVLAGESFRDLARAFSDLPSASDGGDLGFIPRDEMGAYMLDAILKLQPGEISGIIETNKTYQFFKLLGKLEGNKAVKASYDSVRDEIREMLFRKEMDEQYGSWVKGLREQAYIKIQL